MPETKTDWLIDWLIDWLTDWLSDWLTDWCVVFFIFFWFIRSIDRYWLIDWKIDWRIPRSGSRSGWLLEFNNDFFGQIYFSNSFHMDQISRFYVKLLTDNLYKRWQKHNLLCGGDNWKTKHAGKHKITNTVELATVKDIQHTRGKLMIWRRTEQLV